jgi:serine/threonine-protein kinase
MSVSFTPVTPPSRDRWSELRAPFDQALAGELLRLERRAAWGWQLLSLAGALGSVAIALAISRPLGLATGVVSSGFLAWFTFAAWRLRRGATRLVVYGTSVVEIAGPWCYAVVLTFTVGPEYALGSWVPPMIFCALIIASTVRLRALSPILQGVTGAAGYLLFYFGLARSRLAPETAGFVLYRPAMQVTRAMTLLVAGALGALLATDLRRALGRVDAAAREHDLFGKYRLLRTIASGGMGAVVEAVYCPEGGFERKVAVKRIHPHLAAHQPFVDAFRAEAELCAHLSHPNVVHVFDFGRVGETYFLAMEYVEGTTLSALLTAACETRVQIPVDVAGHVAKKLLSGLVYAHEAARGTDGRPLRIVHRDLCPQNVLLSTAGEVKITDFGIARALHEADAAYTQAARGHVAYLAPEQLRGLSLTPRGDLFAVAVMLWEMLTGKRLFARSTEAATLAAVLAGAIPAATGLRAELDPAWDPFFARALASDPEARFESALGMSEALDALPGADFGGARAGERLAAVVKRLGDAPGAAAVSQDDVATADVA